MEDCRLILLFLLTRFRNFFLAESRLLALMSMVALKIPFEYVTPLTWQRYLKCKTGGDKNISKQKAQELFPHLKITHAIADALLIGEYYKRTYKVEEEIDLEGML